MVYPSICLEGPEKLSNIWNIRCPGRDANRTSSEYKLLALGLQAAGGFADTRVAKTAVDAGIVTGPGAVRTEAAPHHRQQTVLDLVTSLQVPRY